MTDAAAPNSALSQINNKIPFRLSAKGGRDEAADCRYRLGADYDFLHGRGAAGLGRRDLERDAGLACGERLDAARRVLRVESLADRAASRVRYADRALLFHDPGHARLFHPQAA